MPGFRPRGPSEAPAIFITDRPEGSEELAKNIERLGRSGQRTARQIELTADHPLLIAGDFNLVPDSPLFTENFNDVSDAYNTVGTGFGWTYYHFYTMVRIDHVLANKAFHLCSVRWDRS